MTRGKRLSDDLRRTLVHLRRTCSTIDEIVNKSNCKRRTVQRILSEHRKAVRLQDRFGRVSLRGRPRKLTFFDVRFIHGLLVKAPELYLDEIKQELSTRRGVEVNVSTIWRVLKSTGFSLKKITKVAIERCERKRAQFRYTFGRYYQPEQVVFVDESSFDRRTPYRRRGWTVTGRRVFKKTFFVRGRRYSLLPALSSTGMLFAQVVEGSFTANRFYQFVEALLTKMQPFPAPNSVVVMDNARIHKDPRVLDLIISHGMRYLFLPPYSPDYNPIELAFSAIKSHVRREGELAREDLDPNIDDSYVYTHLLQASFSVTPEDAYGFFRHCRYFY